MQYKLFNLKRNNSVVQNVVKFNDDGTTLFIPFDSANTDYQAYLKWLEEGNTPEPAEEQ